MKTTQLISKEMLEQNLIDYLGQPLAYASTKTYCDLCDALLKWMKASDDEREVTKAALQHAKEQFDHMCQNIAPPDLRSDWEIKSSPEYQQNIVLPQPKRRSYWWSER